MGIYIFQSTPTVSCVPSVCDAYIFNQHGTGTFTAVGQKYFWYSDRLLASGTTRANSGCPVMNAGFPGCTWVFDASSNTTSFQFFVQIRAAWEPVVDGDTEFQVVYEGDSLPESRAEPRWDATSRSTSATGWIVGEGTALSINQSATTANLTREYIRRDSIRSGDIGFIQATMSQTTTAPANKAGTFVIGYLGLDDNTRWLAIGLNRTQVGFITSAFTFIGTPVTMTTGASHTYKLVKNGTGNVQVFIDGAATAALTAAYTSFSPSVTVPNDYSFFFFGHRSGTNGTGTDAPGSSWTTLWDQVVYKIGNTT